MGDFIVEGGQPLAALMQQAPALAPERLDQIPALPLGARLVVDPWTDRLELLRADRRAAGVGRARRCRSP